MKRMLPFFIIGIFMSLLAASKFNDTNPTTTSNSKVSMSKSFIIPRTATSSVQYITLPSAAYITCIFANNTTNTAANGVTSSTINIYGGAGATLLCPIDVKTSAAPVAPYLVNLDVAAAAAGGDQFDQIIKAQYVDVGGAASAGGPWTVVVEYIV
jgi:hypothetical protein